MYGHIRAGKAIHLSGNAPRHQRIGPAFPAKIRAERSPPGDVARTEAPAPELRRRTWLAEALATQARLSRPDVR
jgi:hypothetical protein